MKKKNMKVLSVCSLASLVISGSVISTTGVKAADVSTTRLGGSDRYETAVKISQNGWKNGSDYVVLANGQGFADALCANPIAKSKDAPILLTTSTSLNSSTLAELKRLNAKHVIIVGGTGVVPTAIENTIKTQLNADVTRYGGADRYETSVKIAAALGNTSKIVLASGRDFADALSAGPAASIEGIPVILTQPDQLPTVTSDYIKSNTNLTKTYVIGETASVSASLYNTLKNPERFGGIDRFETNAKVIDGFKSDFNFNNAYVALGKGPIGNEFADSLTGGALAAKNKNPLVITSNPISSYTTGILKDKLTTSSTLTILGGTGNITDTMVSTLKSAITKSPSTGGGGGSSSTTGNNITTSLKSGTGILGAKYSDYKTKVNNGSLQNKYFTIDDQDGQSNDSYINVNLKSNSDGINNLQDMFTKAKSRYDIGEDGKITDTTKFNDDIANINNKLQTNLANVKIGDKPVLTFLSGLGSQYFNADGTLKADEIRNAIESHSGNASDAYDAFKASIDNQIKKYFTENTEGINLATQSPNLTYEGIEVSKIVKDGTTIFDTDENTKDAVEQLENNFVLPAYNSNSSYFTESYTVYLDGSDYVNIKVNPAK